MRNPAVLHGSRPSIRPLIGVLALAMALAMIVAACGSEQPAAIEQARATADEALGADEEVAPDEDARGAGAAPPVVAKAEAPAAGPGPRLTFNQQFLEGVTSEAIDLEDSDAVFRTVFAGLPAEVTVYPSENYYYFILYAGAKQIWGNIRLPVVERDQGMLSFGYFEFIEFPLTGREGFTGGRFYGAEDGVAISRVDRFTYDVAYAGKQVRFHLHELSQAPPALFELGAGEEFVERTFDESGYQFFLIYNAPRNYLFWVLNEEDGAADVFEELEPGVVVGRRSGFAFLVDEANGGRKVLAAVRQLNVSRNDYYDGPFDQLADNYAEEAGIQRYIVRMFPGLAGRIDPYGYYLDQDVRVALSTYFTYFAPSDLMQIMALARSAEDPLEFIARRGVLNPGEPAGADESDDGSS